MHLVITFDRVGRSRGGSRLTTDASTTAQLEQAIAGHVTPLLPSACVDVAVSVFDPVTGAGSGTLYAGGRGAGAFTVAPADPADPDPVSV